MGYGDELAAQIKHLSQQNSNDRRTIVYGHLASYDPKLGRARWIIPSFTDDGIDYVLTSWAPLATGFTGVGGWGIQSSPIGGATKENPTGGEPCVLHMSETNYGVVVGGHLIANEVNTPPNPTQQPGEIRIKSKSGVVLDFTAAGALSITTPGDVNITATGAMNLTSTGAMMVKSGGAMTLQAPQLALDGSVALGGAAGSGVPIALLGTIDTGGNADITNLATKVTAT